MDLKDIKLYLPQYLSEEGMAALKKELKQFGAGHDSGAYFTTKLKGEPFLFQGDGVKAPICNLPDSRVYEAPVILLSNTCDMDISNMRLNPCRIMYAPILNLEKYIEALRRNGISEDRIKSHVTDIKNQQISQILYLPTEPFLHHNSIVMFDRGMSIALSPENIDKMLSSRFFTLSNYGFYLFLLKISYHFTRIQEKVDRSIL